MPWLSSILDLEIRHCTPWVNVSCHAIAYKFNMCNALRKFMIAEVFIQLCGLLFQRPWHFRYHANVTIHVKDLQLFIVIVLFWAQDSSLFLHLDANVTAWFWRHGRWCDSFNLIVWMLVWQSGFVDADVNVTVQPNQSHTVGLRTFNFLLECIPCNGLHYITFVNCNIWNRFDVLYPVLVGDCCVLNCVIHTLS